jgi:hypothetical protein
MDQVLSAIKYPGGEQAVITITKQESHITCAQSCVQPTERNFFLGIHMQNNWLVLCVTCVCTVIHLYAETRESVWNIPLYSSDTTRITESYRKE